MDKKTFFHKVSQMRAAQREYSKTRSSAALASSKLLEKQIDEEIKRAKAIMAAKAKLFYELVNTDPQTSQELVDAKNNLEFLGALLILKKYYVKYNLL